MSAVSADEYRFSDHPEYVAPLRATISKMAAIDKCDILITPHPSASALFERLAGSSPLISKTGCAEYAAGAKARLENRLAKKRKNELENHPALLAGRAEAMHEDDEWLELFANLPTLVADELEAFNDAKWSIQAYFDAKPDTHDIALLETRLNAKLSSSNCPMRIG